MPAVDRVLPWRRSGAPPVTEELAEVVRAYRKRHPRASTALIRRAYEVAAEAHEGQVRMSGDPYIVHPVAVASILADLGLDDATIAAALLHDAVEDTAVTIEQVVADFGPEVATMVDGMTKLDRVRFENKEAQQAASMRKMLVAMAKDIRVLLIKLADRLHNMRTLAALPQEKQQRIAQETLDVYAPLAHRLGVAGIKWQLEDLAFATLYPKRFAEIEQMVSVRAPEREAYLKKTVELVSTRLAELRIDAHVTGRPKHSWSIYEKMVLKGREFDEIYDLMGIRVVVGSVKDCYAALGTLHTIWKPVQGRFKDYIAQPKFNLYQSLHTTVVDLEGKSVEVQIRTREMHHRAEYGIAAHFAYKEGSPQADVPWLRRIVEWQEDTHDPQEFMETLKVDLDQDEVFVFSPKGKVVTLPVGATPIDFAYSIHTEVGHRCIGARVNSRLVPLDSRLSSGDTVEVFTSKVEGAGPSRDWLNVAVTPRARNKIRQWFSRSRRDEAIANGHDELVKAMRRESLPVQKLANSPLLVEVAKSLHYADVEALHIAIGENHVSAQSVAQRVAKELRGGDREEQLPSSIGRPLQPSRPGGPGIHVEGLDDMLVRLSRCCHPVPGDEIVGYVTTGRGVSVHRADCSNAVALSTTMGERAIEVEWDREHTGSFVATVEVEALDRSRLLRDVTTVLADHHLNIVSSFTHTGTDRVARLRFDFELSDPSHLESLLGMLRRIDSVYDAYRVLPGHNRVGVDG
ncbi:MAG TPA: bifunctional (p)ppGpp synthetase/guanosine-3',5'-bis(diphosphate) 3'-pyrophosphohydrolase [Acidimicrobiales bacterium]|nr:bifunctional (p)ppGpp synthetase/guanosine-3',5'-bis(diphosphate) 3'-pyrophosphohydrolase [Acidimicrobiales bacterium]